jgi:hypothetical protein
MRKVERKRTVKERRRRKKAEGKHKMKRLAKIEEEYI